MNQWKIDRINGLNDEVRELHPVLRELFLKIPEVINCEYTHGNREMGADFLLTVEDPILNTHDYVGIIAKTDSIKQDYGDVERQIKECSVKRTIEGGKKEIFLSQFWVITSKTITKNAQELIHRYFSDKNIKFIDGEKLAKLIEKHNPAYWKYTNINLGKYLGAQLAKLHNHYIQHTLLPTLGQIELNQQIHKKSLNKKRKFSTASTKPTTLNSALLKNKFIFIEGGMGSGKSELLRTTAKSLCVENSDTQTMIPNFLSFRELKEEYGYSFQKLKAKIIAELDDEKFSGNIVFFVDGFDETADAVNEKVTLLCDSVNACLSDDQIKIVISSRPIDEPELEEKLNKTFDTYAVSPLTHNGIMNFVQKICTKIDVTNRLRSDIEKSPLLKTLPKTPLSAILLAKILAENIKEIPSTLPELYSKYTELALGRWDINKGIGSEKEYETVNRITAQLAYYMLANDIEQIGVAELTEQFKDYLNKRQTGQNLDALLTSFLRKTEIISFNSLDKTIQFRHRTFAEYFFAQSLFTQKGKEAPIKDPFNLYWSGVEYFYLGIIRDAPERLTSLRNLVLESDQQKFVKLMIFGRFLLASYQTPYEEISTALYSAFLEATRLYLEIVSKKKDAPLAALPEIQVLSVFVHLLREAYEYEFFLKAITDGKIQASIDSGLSNTERYTLVFFFDALLAGLGSKDAFQNLIEQHEAELSWTIKLGIGHASEEVGVSNDAIRRLEKKTVKAVKGNLALSQFFKEIYETPINDRKTINK